MTTGGTGTAEFFAMHEVITEVQPGSFTFMAADYLDTTDVPYQPTLLAIATVISTAGPRPRGDRRWTQDALERFWAYARRRPRCWRYERAEDEHGKLTPAGGTDRGEPRVGDRMSLNPSHIDTTVNLHDTLDAPRNGQLEAISAIAARGKVQ